MFRLTKDVINSVLNPFGIGIHRVDRLTSLANRAGSDKGNQKFQCHHYTRIYKHLLTPFKDKPIRLLEIGLLHPDHAAWIVGNYLTTIGKASASRAPSLEMWASYLTQADIFGFDLNDFSAIKTNRYKIFRGDAGSRADLARFVEASGGEFDVIIDDASHASHHQQIALGALFQHLRPGGLFIIEDLSWQPPSLEPPMSATTQSLLRQLEANGTFPSQFMTNHERSYLESNVDTVAMYDSLWDGLRGRDALGAIWKRR